MPATFALGREGVNGRLRVLPVEDAAAYREAAESALAWSLGQVRGDDGPWIPESVPADGSPAAAPVPEERDCLYRGVGGIALALAEVRLARDLTDEERAVAEAVRSRLVANSPDQVDPTLYFGLAGDATALRLVGSPDDVALPMALLAETATPVGWPAPLEPGGEPVPLTDVVLGSAGITMAAVWAGGRRSADVVSAGAQAILDTADERPSGLDWPMQVGVPRSERPRMPNYSHGAAGVAAALAVAGEHLGRTDVVAAAVRGAEHLVAIADLADDGFLLPTMDPRTNPDVETVTFTWCHGPAGTSHLFTALAHAGVETVRDVPVAEWRRRCLHSVMTSGLPRRLRPGFWDNDGRCCGTAGVGDVILDAAQDADDPAEAARYLAFARRLGDALLERAVHDEDGLVCWRFTEHRKDPPLLDPGVGWMQGAIGIAAFLLRLSRVVEHGLDTPVADRPDSWWSVPARLRASGGAAQAR
jgi:hypothetical protein